MKSTVLPFSFEKASLQWIVIFGMAIFTSCGVNSTSPDRAHVDEGLPPLQRLKEGNQRFRQAASIHPDQSLHRLHEVEEGQHPFAVVISCSDSRVPPEIIFDQGLGDLFVIRNGGNIIGDYEFGSVEYAVQHLGTNLVVVMGHSNCGAIGAYLEHEHEPVYNHIQSILDYIKSEPEEQEIPVDAENRLDRCIEANILHGLHAIRASEPVLKPRVDTGQLQVIGALYDMHTGEVLWLDE